MSARVPLALVLVSSILALFVGTRATTQRARTIALSAGCAVVFVGVIAAGVGARTRTAEAMAVGPRAATRALCQAELEYYQKYGRWILAGPVPSSPPPSSGVEFPRSSPFAPLAFSPGVVIAQFSVEATASGVRCVARMPADTETGVFVVETTLDGGAFEVAGQ